MFMRLDDVQVDTGDVAPAYPWERGDSDDEAGPLLPVRA